MSVMAMTSSVRCEPSAARWRRHLRALLSVMALLFFASCDGTEPPVTSDGGHVAVLDPCSGKCTEVERCVADKEGLFACARICANQLRCYSSCCLPVDDGSGYNVCRPSNWCYAE
jgi:hypothetical protein